MVHHDEILEEHVDEPAGHRTNADLLHRGDINRLVLTQSGQSWHQGTGTRSTLVMDSQFVLLWVGFVAASAVFSLAAGEPPLVSDDGKRTVAIYGRLIRRFAVVVTIVVLAASIYAARTPNVEQFDAVFFVVFALVIGTYLICEVFRTRFEYDNDTVLATSALRKERAIPWEDVTDISYSHWTSQYVLHLRGGKKLRVSEYLTGGDALMDFARKWKRFNNEKSG